MKYRMKHTMIAIVALVFAIMVMPMQVKAWGGGFGDYGIQINANDIYATVVSDDVQFYSGAEVKNANTVTYQSDNEKIAIDHNGYITIKANYIGQANITINAERTVFWQTEKKSHTFKVYVNPEKAEITSAKYTSDGILIKIKKNIGSVKYQIQDATDKAFTKPVSNSSLSYSSSGYILPDRCTASKYYYRVRGMKKVNGETYYGPWSETVAVEADDSIQVVSASNITKGASTSSQSVSIGAKCKGGAKISYSSNNSNITVSSSGKVTIKKNYVGKATITITAAKTSKYPKTTKKITVTVNPKKATITSLTIPSKKMVLKFKKDPASVKYQIEVATNSSFNSSQKYSNLSYQSAGYYIVDSPKSGKTYYVRVRGMKKVNGNTYYGSWSDVEKLKITQSSQKISAKDIEKTVSSSKKTYSIGAEAKGGASLSYKSSNKNIKVDSKGKVTVSANYIGKATITITSKETVLYKKATKKITFTVKPAKASITSVKFTTVKKANEDGEKESVKAILFKIKKNIGSVTYQVQYATDSKFKHVINEDNQIQSYQSSGYAFEYEKGETYYIRVRGRKKVSGEYIYGSWSNVVKVKAK